MMFLAESNNPLVPTSWEMLITVIGLAQIVLFLFCLFTIYRNPHINAVQKLLWLVVTFIFPLIGPALWLYYARTLKLKNG